MGETVKIDPRNQFSKKLARWTAVFWFAYMTWLSVILILSPVTALYCVYMSLIVTVVMVLNVWAYTRNSIYEKSILAMLDKTKLELTLKNTPGTEKEGDASNEEAEGGGNG